MSTLKGYLFLIIESLVGWLRQNAILYAGSLAYFTIFSLFPLLVIATAIPSIFFSTAAVQEWIIAVAEIVGGEALAGMVSVVLPSASEFFSDFSGPVIALIMLGVIFFGAALIFRQLQVGINVMWGLEPEPFTPKREDVWRNGLSAAWKFFVALAAALAIGFLLLITMLVGAIGSILLQRGLLTTMPAQIIVSLLSFVAVPVVYMLIFGCIFKYLPQGQVRWRDVWPGSILTSILFWLAGYGISVYLSLSPLDSVYGATSALFAFLIWTFTSALIVFFGAKFIQVYAAQYGVPIAPEEGMILKPLPLNMPTLGLKWSKQGQIADQYEEVRDV
jgi:membrane protein